MESGNLGDALEYMITMSLKNLKALTQIRKMFRILVCVHCIDIVMHLVFLVQCCLCGISLCRQVCHLDDLELYAA
jgi:hypothetical protein